MGKYYIDPFGAHEVMDRKKLIGNSVHQVLSVYHLTAKGVKLVWEYIRSCFGKGFWVNEQPWDSKDGWRN